MFLSPTYFSRIYKQQGYFKFFFTSQDALRVIRNTIRLNLIFIFGGCLETSLMHKLALVKLKVFMEEAKILEPGVINSEQFNYIIGGSLDICMAIRADVRNIDSNLKDEKIDQILEFYKNFIEAKDKNDLYNDLMGRIDDLIDMM